ncbi:DNA-binding response OmpR family regulator [Marisediminicola sp. UYEF4]|uniref:response regulator transcription factor n=1 Tax=Marisediminicola sp. UYEF4 TaxID=1756384 RepID=UPI0033940419
MARILVVEDDPDVLTLVMHKLRRAGHDVTSAMDGEAGLASVRAEHPELVILDWMMPRMTGLEVCHAVREDPAVSRTRILMLTAKAQEEDVERAFASGADDYILKPFNSKELLARIDALLARE